MRRLNLKKKMKMRRMKTKIIKRMLNRFGYFTQLDFKAKGWKPQPELINFLVQLEYKKVSPDELEVVSQVLTSCIKGYTERIDEFKVNLAIVESVNFTEPEDIMKATKARDSVANLNNQLLLLKSFNSKLSEILTLTKP